MTIVTVPGKTMISQKDYWRESITPTLEAMAKAEISAEKFAKLGMYEDAINSLNRARAKAKEALEMTLSHNLGKQTPECTELALKEVGYAKLAMEMRANTLPVLRDEQSLQVVK
ncbi:MAG: hypothetical protein KGH66_03565 [Candidatus Micrarchaeota archaeon]|nr:hypothetical protein [Candidatus Micrarchaeota archaeon]